MAKKEIIQTSLGDLVLELHIAPNSILQTRHNWQTNRHSNVDHELQMILSGSCSVEVEGVVYDLCAGQGILILPGKFHKPVSYSEDFDKLLFGFFPIKGSIGSDWSTPCVVLDFTPSTITMARELMDEYAEPGPFHQKMTHSLLDQLAIRLLRTLGTADAASVPVVGADLRVDVIDGFFADFLADDVTKEDLAERLHLSSRQVGRFLQKRYGMSFREKLFNTRMLHAGWLLRHTELSVRQIAPQVGYTSLPAFVRSFTRFHGKTPQQYRDQEKK